METMTTLQRFDGAVLRFYSEARQIVATCVFADPAFRQGPTPDVFLSEPIAPDMSAPGGTMAFAMIQIRGSHTPVGPITVGNLDSDAVFKFEDLSIKRGSMVCVGEIQFRNENAFLTALNKAINPEVAATVQIKRREKMLTDAGMSVQLEPGSLGARIISILAKTQIGFTATVIAEDFLDEPEDDVVLAMNELQRLGYIENA